MRQKYSSLLALGIGLLTIILAIIFAIVQSQ